MANMTKKDFDLIARPMRNLRAIHNSGVEGEHYAYVLTHYAECLADAFESEGKKFDRQKFLTACGIEVACKHRVRNYLGTDFNWYCKDCGEVHTDGED